MADLPIPPLGPAGDPFLAGRLDDRRRAIDGPSQTPQRREAEARQRDEERAAAREHQPSGEARRLGAHAESLMETLAGREQDVRSRMGSIERTIDELRGQSSDFSGRVVGLLRPQLAA